MGLDHIRLNVEISLDWNENPINNWIDDYY